MSTCFDEAKYYEFLFALIIIKTVTTLRNVKVLLKIRGKTHGSQSSDVTFNPFSDVTFSGIKDPFLRPWRHQDACDHVR